MLKEINPGIELPHERVTVVVRANKSGLSDVFTSEIYVRNQASGAAVAGRGCGKEAAVAADEFHRDAIPILR